MKTAFFVLVFGSLFVATNGHSQGRPQLTEDQKTCLEGKIGKFGSGSRPTPEAIKAAFEKCKIERPQGDSMHGPGGGPQLTDEQRSCLDGKIGAPGSGTRPSREQMEAAFSACGIQPPGGPGDGAANNEDLQTLEFKYAAATDDEEKDAIRESIRKLYYSSSDEAVKAQVRAFLRDNPPVITWSSPTVESRKVGAVK